MRFVLQVLSFNNQILYSVLLLCSYTKNVISQRIHPRKKTVPILRKRVITFCHFEKMLNVICLYEKNESGNNQILSYLLIQGWLVCVV